MLRRVPLALTVLMASSGWAQLVISAHSGVIQYVEGQVTLDGNTVAPKFAEFPDVKPDQTLAAEDGRAEILLTPGVFLRLGENSSFRMISAKLDNTRVEVLSGSAIVEVGELLQNNAITVKFHNAEIALLKKGLYRVDSADPASLRVYEGDARVTSGSDTLVARRAHEVELGTVLEARSFDTKQTDAFYRWSARRDEYVAQANITSAKTASESGFASNGYGSGVYGSNGYGSAAGNWAWNPWYGMFTYVPGNGMFMSPFGYSFYSPMTVGSFYGPAYNYYGGYVNPNSYVAATRFTRPITASTTALAARAPVMSSGTAAGGLASGGSMHSGARGGHR
jgi:FecR-like protein